VEQEIISIITNAGRTAEKWDAARKNLDLQASMRSHERDDQSSRKNDKNNDQSSRKKDKRESSRYKKGSKNKFKKDRFMEKGSRRYEQTEEIETSEIGRRKAAGECLRWAWPSDRKGSHRVKHCKRPIKLHKGTASYPKAKEYQKMKIAGMRLKDDTNDSEDDSSENDSSSEHSDSESEEEDTEDEESKGERLENFEDEESEEEQVSEERNWWDSEPESE